MLKFLLAGRELTVEVPRSDRYRVGRDYSAGITHHRTVCRVRVLAHASETSLRVVLAPVPDRPRLLARGIGYVVLDPDDPGKSMHRAMFAEPEAIDNEDLERLTRTARARRRAQLEELAQSVDREAAALEPGASRAERRRLRNLRRAAGSL